MKGTLSLEEPLASGGLKADALIAGVLRADRLCMEEDMSDGEEEVRVVSIVGKGSRDIERNQLKTQDELLSFTSIDKQLRDK
jgi:hypothetical protein